LNKFIVAIIPAEKINKNENPSRPIIPMQIEVFKLLDITIDALGTMEYWNFRNIQK